LNARLPADAVIRAAAEAVATIYDQYVTHIEAPIPCQR
jgi:hypothetical protein